MYMQLTSGCQVIALLLITGLLDLLATELIDPMERLEHQGQTGLPPQVGRGYLHRPSQSPQ